MKRLTLLVCLVAIPIAIFANAHEPYQGDFDLDGDVDFADFLTFASNYGKTGGSTTPSNRVDTVRVVVRDTIYIDSGNGGNTGGGGNTGTQTEITPPDLKGLGVRVSQVPTGWNIKVQYLDLYGNEISNLGKGFGVPQWRNPDKITVTITGNNRELSISDNLIYKGYYVHGYQYGLEILIPKSEISDIYDQSVFRYTTRVVVEFDGKEYTN